MTRRGTRTSRRTGGSTCSTSTKGRTSGAEEAREPTACPHSAIGPLSGYLFGFLPRPPFSCVPGTEVEEPLGLDDAADVDLDSAQGEDRHEPVEVDGLRSGVEDQVEGVLV